MDITRSIARFDAWFNQSIIDRPPVTVKNVWRDGAVPGALPVSRHASPREREFDADFRVATFAARLDCWRWIGDTFPCFSPSLGADLSGAVLGAELAFPEAGGSWARHTATSIAAAGAVPPDLDRSPYWQATRALVDTSLAASQGRWLTAIPNLDCNGDALVALRGPQELSLDLMDDPDGVRAAAERIAPCFKLLHGDLERRIRAAGQPLVAADGDVPSHHRMARLGCDFLALISPKSARNTIYPAIEQHIAALEFCWWHLDSAGELPHLDWILAQPSIRGIQWVYGAGRGPASRWIEVYQRIQDAGKSIELLPVSLQDALDIMPHLRPEGVWIKFFGGLDATQAEALVAAAADRSRWGR